MAVNQTVRVKPIFMGSFFLALLLIWSAYALGAPSVVFQIDPELIQVMFSQHQPNRAVPKRPFNLQELEALFRDASIAEQDGGEIARRYLAISYPAGEVSVSAIARAQLPRAAKIELLHASPANLRLHGLSDLAGLVRDMPPDLLDVLLDVGLPLSGDIDIDALLQLNHERYTRNPHYGTYVALGDKQAEFTLSTPRAAHHPLSRLLDQGRGRPLRYSVSIASCKGRHCRSVAQGESFASLAFSDLSAYGLRAGADALVNCQYQGIYRRDYADRNEIEFRFEACKAIRSDGKRIVLPGLLEQLGKVR